MAHVDDLGLPDPAGDEVHELRDRIGAPASERGGGAEREVGEQDVVAPRLPRRLGTEWLLGPVGDLDGGDVGVREPVTVDVLVVVDDVVEVVDERVERPGLLDRVQTERRLALEGHFRHHAEGAKADACAREHLGLLVARAAQHLAVGGDDLERGHERGQAAEALPAAVGGGRDRARDRLPVDITQVGQRQVTRLQLVVELPQRDATLDGDRARVAIHRDDPVEPAEPQHAAVGAGDAGERVSGAHDLDRLSGPLRPLHRLDDLELARGRLDGRGVALLVATPVAPAGPVAHRPRA